MKKSLQQKISTACALLVFIIIGGMLSNNSYAQNTKQKQKPNFISDGRGRQHQPRAVGRGCGACALR